MQRCGPVYTSLLPGFFCRELQIRMHDEALLMLSMAGLGIGVKEKSPRERQLV